MKMGRQSISVARLCGFLKFKHSPISVLLVLSMIAGCGAENDDVTGIISLVDPAVPNASGQFTRGEVTASDGRRERGLRSEISPSDPTPDIQLNRWLAPSADIEEEPPFVPNPQPGDTDGDGYRDEDEHAAGTDPLDPNSRIYTGGWPYNPNKEDLEATAWEESFEIGQQLPNFRMQDQFGEWVDLYDLAAQGKPIMITLSSMSCWPCSDLAAFLSDGDIDAHLRIRTGVRTGEYLDWWGPTYARIFELIQSGELLWVTVLSDHHYSEERTQIDADTCARWAERFPNPRIPVLADARSELRHFIGTGGVSLVPILLNEKFVVQRFHTTQAFRFLFAEDGPFPGRL